MGPNLVAERGRPGGCRVVRKNGCDADQRSITVTSFRGAATAASRRATPQPPHDDQNASERQKPMIPTTSRTTPAAWTLKPDEDVLTAQIRTAPAAARIKDTP